MNRKQKLALVLGVVTVALMGFYPPWKEVGQRSVPLEYAPIFAPPAPRSPENGLEVDLARLFLQACVVAIVSAGVIRACAQSAADANKGMDNSVEMSDVVDSSRVGELAEATGGSSKESGNQTAATDRKPVSSPVSAITDEEVRALEKATEANGDGVVIRLPTTKRYGNFLVESKESADYWEHHCEARGAVKLPLDRRVQLEVKKEEDVDLSFVSVLASNSIIRWT